MRRAAPRLIGLDLDGTLVDAANLVPEAHVQAVHDLRQLGVRVAIVTGRPMLTTVRIWRDLGLDTPVVCFNGVWIGLPDQPAIERHLLDEGEVREIVAALLPLGTGSISVYPDAERWLMHRFTDHTRGWPQLYRVPIAEDPRIGEDWRGPSCKILFADLPARIPGTARMLQERFGHRFHVVVSQSDRLEVHRPGITKGYGLERLAAHLAIARSEVWAAGDADNDIEMLQWAGLGCAMGQATPGAKAVAGCVLPTIDDGGLTALVPMARELLTAG